MRRLLSILALAMVGGCAADASELSEVGTAAPGDETADPAYASELVSRLDIAKDGTPLLDGEPLLTRPDVTITRVPTAESDAASPHALEPNSPAIPDPGPALGTRAMNLCAGDGNYGIFVCCDLMDCDIQVGTYGVHMHRGG